MMIPVIIGDDRRHSAPIPVAKPSPFGEAVLALRTHLRISQREVGQSLGTYSNTVYRWETSTAIPSMEMRIALLRLFKAGPRPLLEALATASNVSLESAGIAKAEPVVASAAPLPTAPPAPPLPPTAQTTVDDAVREAAEEIDVSPKALRPVLSRMLDRLAKSGVPMDAAARMVLGVPKKAPPARPS